MAIGWLTVIKSIPWVDVITQAPQFAKNATKLWNPVANKTSRPVTQSESVRPDFESDPDAMAWFYDDHQALRSEVLSLQRQMLASSEWVNSLAEQNGRIVQRVASHLRALVWLAIRAVILGMIAISTGILATVR